MAGEGSIFDDVLGEVKSGTLDVGAAVPAKAPGAPPVPSIFQDTLGEVKNNVQAQRNVAVLAGSKANPDAYQAHKSMAEAFGVSTEFAARNEATLKPELQKRELGDLLGEHPAIADWYAQGDNPASIKVDELRQLSGLSWLWGAAGAALDQGNQQAELDRLRLKQFNHQATPEEISRANEMSAGQAPRTFAADSWMAKGWVGAFSQASNLGNSIYTGVRRGLEFGTVAAAGAAVLGQLGPQIAAPEELLTVPGAYAGGFLVGTTFGAWQASFNTEVPQAYDEFLMMRDENGQPLNPEVARAAALVSGLGSSILETTADTVLAKILPGSENLFGVGARDAVKAALLQPTVREALQTFSTNTLKAGATEMTTEVAQEATQILVGELAKVYANTSGAEFEMMEPGQIAQRLGDAAVQTAQAMTIMGPILSGTRLGSDLRRAKGAAESKRIVEALHAHAEGNAEAIKRIPAKVQDAIATLTKDGPIQNVFVAPDAFATYFQDTNELAKFMDEVGLANEFGEAQRLGRDVQIPIDVYYTKIAGSDIGEAVKKFARISQDVMAEQEADDFNEAWDEAKQSLFADYEAGQAEQKQSMEGEERVYDDVKTQAMSAGITPDQSDQYAKLYSTFFRVMGEKAGVDAHQLFQKYGLSIQRALPEEARLRPVDQHALDLAVIRAGKIEGMRKTVGKAAGPSLLDFVKEKGGIHDDSGELAAMDLPKRLIKPARDKTGNMLGGDTGNENTLDAMARRAWEEGYFPELGEERPGTNDLLNAMRLELAGEKRHSSMHDTRDKPEIAAQAGLVAFSDALDAAGIDVSNMTDAEVAAELTKLINDDPLTGAFFQETEKAMAAKPKSIKRGSIQFGDGVTIINMFDQADLSTFLHESGHFFLQVYSDIAAQNKGDLGIANDWATLAEYLGINDDGSIPVEAHEKFARSFEAYLFEGKTPSAELGDAMTRFRSWLVFVYKQVTALRAPITDEVRGVMDRMLATDEEIAAMQTAPEFRPAFKSAEEAGMTPEQWTRYNISAERAVDRAKRELDVKMMSEIARQTSSEWRAAKTSIRKSVKAEYENIPAYRVQSYLRTGNLEGLPEGTPAWKLDRDAIVKMMGEGALIRMPKGVPPLYRTKGGVHPDAVAELFGFQSGHEMLTAMMSAPPLGRAITEEVALRMRAKFGDLMGDANARVREAEAAIANDDTGELLQAELEVLVRKGLVGTKINREAASRAAKRLIRAKPIREAIRLKLYMNANAKAAAEAEKAILKGDWKGAIAAKQRQLLNHYMAIEAREAQKASDRAVEYLSKFTGKKRPKGITNDYLEQIDGLLERFDLRKSVGANAAAKRASLSEWIAAQEAAGLLVSIPDALRNDALRKPYRDMTVDDLLALTDTVKSIEHLGRLKDKLLANKAAREFGQVRDEVLASIIVNQELKRASPNQNPTTGEKLLSMVKSIDAALLKVEQVLNWMDGGDINGALRRHVWEPIAQAEARENDMRVTYTGKIFDIMGGLDAGRMAERITVDAVQTTFTRSEIMAVALNMGNTDNREKLLRGGNGKGAWTEQDLAAIVTHLNAGEWQAVQKMWDTINELWPDIAALQKRLSGVAPPKIEAAPVVTPFGTLSGGYYPVIYDPARSAAVSDRQAVQAGKLFENTYLKPETIHGFTKERTKGDGNPLLLNLDSAGSHIIAVIHDLTHREAIMDAHKILTDRTVRAEIEARHGPEIYQQFVPWLQSIAHDNVKNDGLQGVNAVLRGVRSRATMVGMGFRISTVVTQVAGFSSVAEMVHPRYIAMGMAQFIKAPRATWAAVAQQSAEMRHRGNQLDRDVRDELRRLAGKHTLADDVKRFAFHGIGYMDKVVTVPAWQGAYAQHLAKYPGDVKGATAFADHVIRMSQGAGGAKDLAAIQRQNEGTKLITMFYSYFSAYYNRQRTWGRAAKKAIANGEFADLPQLLAQQVFMTVGPALIADLVVGKGPGDDETYAAWALKKVALYPFMALPLVRDAANALTSGFGYSFSPAGRTVQEALVDPIQTIAKIAQGKAGAREVAVQALTTTGYVLNLPVGQLATTVNNVWKAIEEDDLQLRDFVVSR